jgi:hypothetical protein
MSFDREYYANDIYDDDSMVKSDLEGVTLKANSTNLRVLFCFFFTGFFGAFLIGALSVAGYFIIVEYFFKVSLHKNVIFV